MATNASDTPTATDASDKVMEAAVETGSAKPVTTKIDAALAEVKAAPAKVRTKRASISKPRVAKAPVRKAPKAPASRTASPVSKLKDKIMTTDTTDFTATVKNATADVQARAKAAYDKLQAYAGEATDLAKGNVEAIVESGKILGAGVQDLARGEVEAAKGAFETVTADLKAMVAVKNPAELFKLQGEIARRNFDAAVARASRNAEVSMKLVNEAFAPISSRMSVVAEKISKAA